MKKYVFWSILHKNANIALNEDLSRYAQGDTFWKAMLSLCVMLKEWIPAAATEESDINQRLKMYYETGINKVEIFVERDGDRYAVKCANSRSLINAATEKEALTKYVEARAKTSEVNIGQKIKDDTY